MKLSYDDIRKRLKWSESNNLEFKEGFQNTKWEEDRIFDTIIAMANTEGGNIIVGVTESSSTHKREIVGTRYDSTKLGDKLHQLIYEFVDPLGIKLTAYSIESERADPKLIGIEVEKQARRFYAKRYFGRSSMKATAYKLFLRINGQTITADFWTFINFVYGRGITEIENLNIPIRTEIINHTKLLAGIYKKLDAFRLSRKLDGSMTFAVPRYLNQYRNRRLVGFAEGSIHNVEAQQVEYIDYIEWAISHLQHEDYQKLYNYWKHSKQILDEYNNRYSDIIKRIANKLNLKFQKSYPVPHRILKDLKIGKDTFFISCGKNILSYCEQNKDVSISDIAGILSSRINELFRIQNVNNKLSIEDTTSVMVSLPLH